jgi:type II secretory pathway component PulM
MSNTDQSQKIELNEVMLAMDVVDTLRHQQSVVDRELGAADHDRALIEKVRKIYAGQGLTVSDEIIAEGVRALREERFAYRPPGKSFQLTLAHLYVNRGRWAKRGALLIAALLAIYLVYQFAVVAPQKRTRQQQQRALQELKAMPAKLTDQRDRVLAVAREDKARQQAEGLYQDALAAVSRQDAKAVDKGYAALRQLYVQLTQQYQVRIVSRQGTSSGVWRVPQNNPNARNYYIVVEAVTTDGKRLTLPVTSEEDGKTRTVEQWGLRVKPAVFEQVKRDKMDDGIINRNVFGVKKRGYLAPQYRIPTTGGAITKW